MSGDLKPRVQSGVDAQASSVVKTRSSPASLMDAFHAGIASAQKPEQADDLRVPGVAPDVGALVPRSDAEHAPTSTNRKQPAYPAVGAAPDSAETLATMKASAFNLELEVLRHSKDPSAKYKLQDVLERADDSLTRKKLKEQYAAANDGQTIESMITSSGRLGERDKKHALDLMSDRRDATTDKLAAMEPKARAKLEDDAAVWADKLLHITRSDDRDDSDHADQIANILGSRTPEELEVLRSRVRLQTSGTERTTTYEELDRTFTGRDKDIVLAGLTGSPTHLASTRLVDAAMEGDPARIHRIVKELKPEKLAELRTMNPMLLAQLASSMPAEHRAEIEAALGGRVPEAEGARIATLLQPVDLTVADTRDAAKTKRLLNRKEAQEPERMIEELGKMSAADLEAARDAWDKGNPGKSWDALIGERYKDADSTVRLRIEAAARGDKIGERALRLRQGMRTFDQQLIDGALYNPDLKSEDPKKRSVAQAERRELEARMEQYDAGDQRTKAMLEGKYILDAVAGRSTDEQLDAYYKKAEVHDSEASGDSMDRATHIATKDERMAKVREQANADRYAAKEMSREGEAHASTKVRRAELSGNSLQKAELLEKLDSKDTKDSANTLEAQSAEYRMKFGARDMIAAPKLSNLTDAAEAVAMLTGDERAPDLIAAELARDDMDLGELRVEHVRETGVVADRTRAQRLEQQNEIRDLTHSGWLEGSEHMRFLRGGNRGSEDLLDSSINLMERGVEEGVDAREQSRRDRSTTQAVALQRDEKQREAAKVAQVISIASKIAAIATANPALFVAVDAGFGLLRVAANELIANESNDMTSDFKHLGVDVGVNATTAGFGRLGKGVQAGTQTAKGVQTAQRLGNAGAAMGGAAAHAEIDGEAGGGAVWRAGLGAVLPGMLRGRAENAIQGTGKVASVTRAGLGTGVDVASGFGISGQVDGGNVVDAVANTVQGHGQNKSHGTKPTRTAGDSVPHPYAHYADDPGPSHAEAHDQRSARPQQRVASDHYPNSVVPPPSSSAVDANRGAGGHVDLHARRTAHSHDTSDQRSSSAESHEGSLTSQQAAAGVEVRRAHGDRVQLRQDGDRTIIDVPAHATPHEAERMVAGTLAAHQQRMQRAALGEPAHAASALGAKGTGRGLSPDDHAQIAELRVAREQLAAGMDPGETGRATARVRQLEQSMGLDDSSPEAAQRRNAVEIQIDVQRDAQRRAETRAQLDGAHGHPGIEVHSHFMGVVKAEVFRQRAATAGGGTDAGSWRPLLDTMHGLPALEREHFAKTGAADPSSYVHERAEMADGSGGPITRRAKAGDAYDIVGGAMKQVELLERRMVDAKGADREAYQRAIEHVAEEAAHTALSATPETPFDGAYVMRDALVQTTFGSDADRATGNPQAPFDDLIRETVLQLADDGVRYSEQSTGINKLSEKTSPERIQAAIDGLVEQGRLQPGEIDIKMLGMMKTADLGGADERIPGAARTQSSATDHARDASRAFALAEKPGVLGPDYGGPEHLRFNAEGQARFEGDYDAALAVAATTGQPVVLRPHVGEGAVDTVDGQPFHTDKDRHVLGDEPSHYQRARDNIEVLLSGLENRRAAGTLDPSRVIVRFGHATHATPDQVNRMWALGVIAEVNLGSNVATGSVSQTDGVYGKRAAQERLGEHALPSMLFTGTDVLLSTDGGGVMNTTLRAEYDRAFTMIEAVLSGAQPIRVTERDATLNGQPRGRPSPTQPGVWELDVSDLTPDERARFSHGYEKLHRDAEAYYLRRPDPTTATTASPLGGAHHIGRAVDHGLVSNTGTASFEGSRAQVDDALAAYAAEGYKVTRPTPDAPIAVVTLMKKVGDKDIPQFTTTLIVRDDAPVTSEGPS